MRKKSKKWLTWLFAMLMVLGLLVGCSAAGSDIGKAIDNRANHAAETIEPMKAQTEESEALRFEDESLAEPDKRGSYTSKDEVALYLHTYGCLTENYITKKEAQELGWDNRKGNLWEVASGMSIGGSPFGNYEDQLPKKKGRKYYECDLNYEGGYRGEERLVYSNDGLIYYTGDHYQTFELLYE